MILIVCQTCYWQLGKDISYSISCEGHSFCCFLWQRMKWGLICHKNKSGANSSPSDNWSVNLPKKYPFNLQKLQMAWRGELSIEVMDCDVISTVSVLMRPLSAQTMSASKRDMPVLVCISLQCNISLTLEPVLSARWCRAWRWNENCEKDVDSEWLEDFQNYYQNECC